MWVFSTDGFSVQVGYLELGADRALNPLGVLTITQTAAITASITRLETDTGRYQLSADCTVGSLVFNVGSRPVNSISFW